MVGRRAAAATTDGPVPPAGALGSGPSGAGYYFAHVDHEYPSGNGVIRVEAGNVVVKTDHGIAAMPPERFAEAHPGLIER